MVLTVNGDFDNEQGPLEQSAETLLHTPLNALFEVKLPEAVEDNQQLAAKKVKTAFISHLA